MPSFQAQIRLAVRDWWRRWKTSSLEDRLLLPPFPDRSEGTTAFDFLLAPPPPRGFPEVQDLALQLRLLLR